MSESYVEKLERLLDSLLKGIVIPEDDPALTTEESFSLREARSWKAERDRA